MALPNEFIPALLIHSACRTDAVIPFRQLTIPEDQRYIAVRCNLTDDKGDLTSQRCHMLESVSEQSDTYQHDETS